MIRFRHALLAVFLPLVPPATAAPPDVESATVQEIVKGVEDTYRDITSLKADFVQITRSAALGSEDRQRGRIQLKRPRKMRMEFVGPAEKLMVTDGKTIWLYSPADKQAFVYRDLGTGGGDLGVLLDDLDKLGELFDVTLIDKKDAREGKSWVLELLPRKDAAFKKLRVVLDRKKYTIEKLVIVDQLDNETELAFSQVKLNLEMPDGDFLFDVPAGIQVVEGM